LPFSQLVEILLYVLPGFVALKLVYMFGVRQRRTDLEWVVWSIALSTIVFVAVLPIRALFHLAEDDGTAIAAAYPVALRSQARVVALHR